MSEQLSAASEAFIQEALNSGRYASRDELLESAIVALRDFEKLPMVPEEHRTAVEEGLADLEAGRVSEMTEADWERLRQIARDAAARQRSA